MLDLTVEDRSATRPALTNPKPSSSAKTQSLRHVPSAQTCSCPPPTAGLPLHQSHPRGWRAGRSGNLAGLSLLLLRDRYKLQIKNGSVLLFRVPNQRAL